MIPSLTRELKKKKAESPIIMLFMLQESYKQAYFMANGATTLQTSTWK
jgi:hypothetical protein